MNIEDVFPLEGQITQEIIDKANIMCPNNCIGALTLKAALLTKLREGDFEPSWGTCIGHPTILRKTYTIMTKGKIDLMEVKKPQKVTFILYKP